MKKLIVSLLAFAMVVCLGACTSGNEGKTQQGNEPANKQVDEQEKDLDIGVLVWKFSDTFGSSIRVAMDKYAQDLGKKAGCNVKLEMQDGNDDQATQNNQADVMFAANKDLIVINLATNAGGQYLIDLAKKNNVPVLFYNREPTEPSIITDSKSIFIGTAPEEGGIMQGEILADLFAKNAKIDRNGDGKLQYLMFEGEVNNSEAIARTEYSVKTAEEKGLKMENLSENQVASWDTGKAQDMMTAQIAALGVENIEVVFCNNDDMAIGVIAALNQVGYNLGDDPEKTITVIGVDATDTAMEYVKAGKLAGTVKQDGDAMGKAVIELAMNGAQGKDWLEGTGYKLAADGWSIRIPYVKITNK